MNNYDRKISLTTLNASTISQINALKTQNPQQKILIEIPNTKGISSELLKNLDKGISIRIEGGYDKSRANRLGQIKDFHETTGIYCTTSVIYTRDETISIISEMEEIEKGLEGQGAGQIEKLVYIYGRLKSGIMYDPKFEKKPSRDIRSLRGLVTKQTVCAGYALILKEMLDRQGIHCEFVVGKTKGGNGHAWNIVTIDGKNYPIDLTWDNCRFRSGAFKTFDFLGQDIKKFQEGHVPGEKEPCKDYVLSEMDSELIREINIRFSREKDYKSTTYYGTRKDGSRYMVAQVGDDKILNKNCYRYYYADLAKDGTLSNPSILYSETSLINFIEDVKWNRPIIVGYEEAIDNVLFSKENINDSLKRGTGYIGNVIKDKKDGKNVFQLVERPSDIRKPHNKQKQLQYPTKVFKRTDGSTFIVQKMNNGKDINGTQVITFHIFEVIQENGKNIVKRNVVFSEKDFLKDNSPSIANDFLSRERLDRKNREAAGYLGYYSENGIRTYNSNLVEYFKTTHNLDPNSLQNKDDLKESSEKQLTPKQAKRKKAWIKQFIEDYKASSINNDGLRFSQENENISKVLDSIRTNSFDIAENLNINKNGEYNVMRKLARLLIVADNLTIDGGTNYLETFSLK